MDGLVHGEGEKGDGRVEEEKMRGAYRRPGIPGVGVGIVFGELFGLGKGGGNKLREEKGFGCCEKEGDEDRGEEGRVCIAVARGRGCCCRAW